VHNEVVNAEQTPLQKAVVIAVQIAVSGRRRSAHNPRATCTDTDKQAVA
jgi:hypothetical protein